MRPTRPYLAALLAAALAVAAGLGAAPASEPLDLDTLFVDGAWDARQLPPTRWLDGERYATLEPSATLPAARDIVAFDAASGERRILVAAEELRPPEADQPLLIEDWSLSADGRRALLFTDSQRVWRTNSRGDYWLFDLERRELRRIDPSAPASSLMFATFSPDGTRVAFVRENDLWLEDLRTATVTRLTFDGSATLTNGTGDWVYEEELGLRQAFRWSPDGSRIAFWQIDDALVREFVLVDNLAGPYPELRRFPYPKAGEVNPAARIGVVAAGGGPITWVRLPGSTRDNYVARMEWAGNGELVVQQLNRRQDTLRVFLADAATGRAGEILAETDAAWVDVRDELYWIDGGRAFTWTSERDGWRRIYRVSRDGADVQPLTPEAVEVIALLDVDSSGGWLWYLASPEDPTRRALYRVPLAADPQRAERISPPDGAGTHDYRIAPGARWALHESSSFADPPWVALVSLPDHRSHRTLIDNRALREQVARLDLRRQRFRVAIEDGVELDGWALLPTDHDPDRAWPVLFYVYGEPWGQTVLDRWGGRTLLWHHWLTTQGWVVMSIDNRGTPAPRGRAWRKIVYGEIGTLASADQAAAVRAIAERHLWVDTERIGVWGWSGGGSMTLNLMFRYPELYATGMAVAPVPDQRLYDTIYQERYMGRPQDNPEGYAAGSPLSWAHRLEGDLLLVHGTGDDNVHYQGTEALIDRLIEHGKHFTMMAYPNRSHSISEGRGTTRHLYGLLSRYLREQLPPGARQPPR